MSIKYLCRIFVMGGVSTLGSLAVVKAIDVCNNPYKKAQIKKSINNIKNQFTNKKTETS